MNISNLNEGNKESRDLVQGLLWTGLEGEH